MDGNGGEHWNSTILSHAYYLAIEGGTNRTTGLSVEGVGDASRSEVERIFFRAIVDGAGATAPRRGGDVSGGGAEQQRERLGLAGIDQPPGAR